MKKVYIDTTNARKFWKGIPDATKVMQRGEFEKNTSYIVYTNNIKETQITLKKAIRSLSNLIKKASQHLSSLYDKKHNLFIQLQKKCPHSFCLERQDQYRDEYDVWHNGFLIRKCINCYLIEQNNFNKLKNSQVIALHKIIDNEEFELEWKDLEI